MSYGAGQSFKEGILSHREKRWEVKAREGQRASPLWRFLKRDGEGLH